MLPQMVSPSVVISTDDEVLATYGSGTDGQYGDAVTSAQIQKERAP